MGLCAQEKVLRTFQQVISRRLCLRAFWDQKGIQPLAAHTMSAFGSSNGSVVPFVESSSVQDSPEVAFATEVVQVETSSAGSGGQSLPPLADVPTQVVPTDPSVQTGTGVPIATASPAADPASLLLGFTPVSTPIAGIGGGPAELHFAPGPDPFLINAPLPPPEQGEDTSMEEVGGGKRARLVAGVLGDLVMPDTVRPSPVSVPVAFGPPSAPPGAASPGAQQSPGSSANYSFAGPLLPIPKRCLELVAHAPGGVVASPSAAIAQVFSMSTPPNVGQSPRGAGGSQLTPAVAGVSNASGVGVPTFGAIRAAPTRGRSPTPCEARPVEHFAPEPEPGAAVPKSSPMVERSNGNTRWT